jgi:hypothetical protein
MRSKTRINWWAKGARPIADIPVTARETTRLFCTGFQQARYYLPFPDLRGSDASTLRTSDWEIPNCLAMREGVIPALKIARTALTWPRVNATLGSSGCRRSGDFSAVVDSPHARCSVLIWVVGRITGVLVSDLPRRCSSSRVAAKSRSSSPSSSCLSALERSLGSTCRDDNLPAALTTAADCWADVKRAGV